MNLAIRLYSDIDISKKPSNIPDVWPAQVLELGSSTELPNDGNSWSLMTTEEYNAYLATHQADYDAWEDANLRPSLPDITPRQIRQALILSGVSIAMIDEALDSLSEPTKSLARIEWEYSVAFQRNRPLVSQVGVMLGWTENQIDDLWRLARSL